DGITALDFEELSEVLRAPAQLIPTPAFLASDPAIDGRGRRQAGAAVPAGRASMVQQAGSFRWLRLDEPTGPRRKRMSAAEPSGAAPWLSLPSSTGAYTTAGV